LPIWGQPKGEQIFDDTDFWDMPEDGFPGSQSHDHSPERSLENGSGMGSFKHQVDNKHHIPTL
jgi:hypothetical protein